MSLFKEEPSAGAASPASLLTRVGCVAAANFTTSKIPLYVIIITLSCYALNKYILNFLYKKERSCGISQSSRSFFCFTGASISLHSPASANR